MLSLKFTRHTDALYRYRRVECTPKPQASKPTFVTSGFPRFMKLSETCSAFVSGTVSSAKGLTWSRIVAQASNLTFTLSHLPPPAHLPCDHVIIMGTYVEDGKTEKDVVECVGEVDTPRSWLKTSTEFLAHRGVETNGYASGDAVQSWVLVYRL